MADLASLVIGLRADVAQLQSDLGKATDLNRRYAKQASDSWNSAASSIADGFKNIAGAIGIGLSVDKLIEFGKQAIDTADQVGKMAQKVGISVESLSALRVQANLSEVSVDQLQGGLARLARNAADAAGGSKQQAAAFQAMGVSLKDANGNLRSTQEILSDVASKFSSYRDSAEKTALAQQLFGKSGADLIPLLNDLGKRGFGDLEKAAKSYGALISGELAEQSNHFNDNLTLLKTEAQGFASAVTAELLPGLNSLTDNMVKAGQTTDGYADSAKGAAEVIKGFVLALIIAKETLSGIATVTFAFYDAIKTSFTAAAQYVGTWAAGVYQEIKGAFTLDPAAIDSARANMSAGLAKISADTTRAFGGIKEALGVGLAGNIESVRASYDALFGAIKQTTDATDRHAKAAGNLTAPLVANAQAAKDAADAQKAYADQLNKAGSFIAGLGGKIDPVNKAYQDYVATIIKANQIGQDIIETSAKAGKASEGYARAQQFLAQASGLANQALDKNLAAIERQADVVGRLNEEYKDQASLIGLTDRQRAIQDAVNKATAEWQKNSDAMIENKQTLDEVQKASAANAASIYDMTEAAKNSQEVAREFESIWKQAGDSIADSFSRWVVEGGSLMKSLTSIAKQVVEQIISYFAKLAFINPILNALGIAGAGGGGLLPTLASAAGLGGAAAGGYSGSYNMGGPSGTFLNSGNLMTAGQTMWSGFQKGLDGLYASGGIGNSFLGNVSYGDFGNTFAPSGFTYGAAAVGGAYAGYNRYQQAGGGIGGVAGGITYGVGTYTAGIAGAAAISGGLSAGLAAIGPIGWVAIGLMVIDSLSGGKLFGTKGKFNFGQQALNVGPTGATVTAGYDLKGQQALFGGSTHSWQDLPVAQEAIDAANQFFEQLKNGTEQFATQFGKTVGDIVGGQFIQTFDKHGNVTATSSVVLGKTYNDTAQQFQERLVAENQLAVLGQFDAKLSDAIDKYRQNADQLYAIVSGLAQAQLMMNKGTEFLALGADQSATSLLHLAEANQQFGETIDQTIQRIVQAQAQYDQFIAQFKAPTSYVDDFEATLSGINQQMQQNIATANALAQAAGASGASEKDLAAIHEYAARQAAAAIMQLEQSAQSLAFQLGLTTVGSLSDVSAEIQRLQAKADAGGNAIHSFGNAMSTAAQKATDAMNLLLGDLSPLNDQQKLQTALGGLRAGTVTQQQVLEIGRRLYASSQQYTDLFNMVQSMGRGMQTAQVAGSGTGGGGGLTGAERQRLSDLLKEQDKLQQAQQYQQYQTLAQQIAEIAAAKGEDWRQVVEDMGINISDFEKGLKMTDAQTDDFIKQQQKQLDSNNENTKSIIATLNDGFNRVVVALGGQAVTPPTDDTGSSTSPTPPPGSFGHSGHGRDYQVGQEVGRGFRDVILASGPRGTRQRMPA